MHRWQTQMNEIKKNLASFHYNNLGALGRRHSLVSKIFKVATMHEAPPSSKVAAEPMGGHENGNCNCKMVTPKGFGVARMNE